MECLKILAEAEAVDWNVKMSSGEIPIMHCLKENKMEMFDILVKCPRVDLNIKNDGDGDEFKSGKIANSGTTKSAKLLYVRSI